MDRHDVDTLVDEVGVAKAAVACKVASVLFTYRCSISCRHCCFGCGPMRPDVVMSPQQCVDTLAMLHETGRVVHIAGGEPMVYWEVLAESVKQAHDDGVAPHFIQTNCSFASSDEIVAERFRFLAAHGVRGLYASADPYHQEFVPAERFLRVRRIAGEVFGEQNFYGPLISEETARSFESITRDETRLREHVRQNPPIMLGTAHQRLARYEHRFGPHVVGKHRTGDVACAEVFVAGHLQQPPKILKLCFAGLLSHNDMSIPQWRR